MLLHCIRIEHMAERNNSKMESFCIETLTLIEHGLRTKILSAMDHSYRRPIENTSRLVNMVEECSQRGAKKI
jgi:hypothetical protein